MFTVSEKKPKYKLETWKRKKWKGTQREQQTTIKRLVKRDKNGQFSKGSPVIYEIKERTYGSGVYYVGYKKGKATVRQLKAKRNVQWYENRKEAIASHKLYRASVVLNNVQVSKSDIARLGAVHTSRESWTTGFRIVAFSRNQSLLKDILKTKMKQRLIEFIEKIIKYDYEEWWFDSYWGYEYPTEVNAFRSENGKYYCWVESPKGMQLFTEKGSIESL